MTLTRRDATKLVLAGAGLAAAPLPALAASNEEWAKRLEKDLNRSLKRGCNGRFSVKGFGQARRSDGKHHFRTVVQLDWPPGMRSRLFNAIEPSEAETYGRLLGTARDEFGDAWPGCVER